MRSFPQATRPTQLLNTAAMFAVGFLMRPIGGWVLGRYADRRGRKAALTLSVLLMCARLAHHRDHSRLRHDRHRGAGAAGVRATAARIQRRRRIRHQRDLHERDRAASSTRLLFRHSLRDAGHGPAARARRAADAAVRPADSRTARMRGAGAFRSSSAPRRRSWRLYLRRNLAETDAFTNSRAKPPMPVTCDLLLQHPREVLIVIGLTMGGTLFFYMFTTYMQKFLVNTVGLTKGESTLVSAAQPVHLHAAAAADGRAVGSRRTPAHADYVRRARAVHHRAAAVRAGSRRTTPGRAFVLIMTALRSRRCTARSARWSKPNCFRSRSARSVSACPTRSPSRCSAAPPNTSRCGSSPSATSRCFYWYVTGCVFCSLLVYVFMRETQRDSRI